MDEEFEKSSGLINNKKENFSNDEQLIITSWLEKLSEASDTPERKQLRNEYARALLDSVRKKQLPAPFNEPPPEGELLPLEKRNRSFDLRAPCQVSPSFRPTYKDKKKNRNLPLDEDFNINEFEDPEEMAKVIARSKGQSLAEFVSAISRHTIDFGQELHRAMKLEISSFKEYVDNALSQRIQDLTEILDEEQNRELQKIKKDTIKWKTELDLVRRRIEEMIPEFDLDEYQNNKNYLNQIFQIKPEVAEDDPLKKWDEETAHRLKWTKDRTCKIAQTNEKTMEEIGNVKYETAILESQDPHLQQNYRSMLNCEMSEYKALLSERDKLIKGNNELLAQLKSMNQ